MLLLALSGVYAQGIKVIYHEQMKDAPIEMKMGTAGGVSITTSSSTEAKQGKSMMLVQYKDQSVYEPFITQSEAAVKKSIDPKFREPEIFAIRHKNRKTGRLTSQETLFGEQYLVVETLADFGWKQVAEEKKVGNYTCKKAVDASGEVTAWYCPDIPSGDGPGIYQGLPGLILQIERKEGKITAVEIDTEYTLTKRVVAPVNGKKTDRKSFDALKKEKIEESGIQGSGITIKIQ